MAHEEQQEMANSCAAVNIAEARSSSGNNEHAKQRQGDNDDDGSASKEHRDNITIITDAATNTSEVCWTSVCTVCAMYYLSAAICEAVGAGQGRGTVAFLRTARLSGILREIEQIVTSP